MIKSAEEFVQLRTSIRQEDYLRAATDTAPLEVWNEVLEKYLDMKEWVAHNKTTPIVVLRILASDSNPRVRFKVAMKNKLPRDMMMLLANDVDETVRHRIACNKNADSEILQRLAKDQSELVSSSALSRLRCLEK